MICQIIWDINFEVFVLDKQNFSLTEIQKITYSIQNIKFKIDPQRYCISSMKLGMITIKNFCSLPLDISTNHMMINLCLNPILYFVRNIFTSKIHFPALHIKFVLLGRHRHAKQSMVNGFISSLFFLSINGFLLFLIIIIMKKSSKKES